MFKEIKNCIAPFIICPDDVRIKKTDMDYHAKLCEIFVHKA